MTASFPILLSRPELGKIAMVGLRAGRMVMESGARAQVISQCVKAVVTGLGAGYIGLRIGYASLAISLGDESDMVTRMISVGRHGVNHRLDQAVRDVVSRVGTELLTSTAVEDALDRIERDTPKYSLCFKVVAVAAACASFGRLLGTDWASFAPIFVASGIAQILRHHLLNRHLNPCVAAAIVAFCAAMISGIGARMLGSFTTTTAMMASVLLLVPGVPATNAQTDIMDGHPTTGSARAVSVMMIMVFVAVGVWLAGAALGVHP